MNLQKKRNRHYDIEAFMNVIIGLQSGKQIFIQMALRQILNPTVKRRRVWYIRLLQQLLPDLSILF